MDNLEPVEESRSKRISTSFFALLVLAIAFALRIYSNRLISIRVNVADFGDYTAVVSGIILLATIMLIGSDTAMLKFMSHYFSSGNLEKAKGFLLFFLRLFMRLSMGIIVITSCVAFLQEYDKNFFFDHYLSNHIFLKYFWLSPIILLTFFLAKLLRALKYKHSSQLLLNLMSRTTQILLLFGMIFYQISFTTRHLVLTFAVAYLVTGLSILLMLKFVTPRELTSATENIEDKSIWVRVSSEIFVANFFFSNLPMIIIIIDKLFDTHPKNVGYLSLITLVSGVLWLSSNSTQLAYQSEMQKALINNNYAHLQTIVNEWVVQLLFITLSMIGLFYIFHDSIFAYFGPKYASLLYPTLFYMFVSLPVLATSPLTTIMIYGGEEKVLAIVAISSFIAAVSLGGIIIHFFGFWGALSVVAALDVVATVLPIIVVKRKMNIVPYRFLRHA